MITCKICESDILAEKLGDHSFKCKEVTELKEHLFQIVQKMESYADKASSMKNSLEVYATKQRKTQKKVSRGNSINVVGDPCSPASTKDSLSSLTTLTVIPVKGDNTEVDTQVSEEEKLTPKKDGQGGCEYNECSKKMTDEEHEKSLKEARKGVFALKKIIAYANKVNAWTYENELDFDVKSELEVVYADIEDPKVAEFLQNFMNDLTKFMDLKKQYIIESEKLIGVTHDQYKNIKNQFQAQKSISFKQKRCLNLKGSQSSINRFKEDAAYGLLDSPDTKKRVLPFKQMMEFASPSHEKRALPKQPASPFGGLVPKLASSNSLESLGRGLLQNNANHVAQRSLFSGTRNNNNRGGLDALREKLNALAHQDSEEKETAVKNNESEHLSNLAKYKEKVRNKQGRFTATNLKEIVENKESPSKEESPEKKTNPLTGSPVKNDERRASRRLAKAGQRKRTNSMDLIRTLHTEENTNALRFPSLLDRDLEGDKVGNKEDKEKTIKIKKRTSEDSPNLLESPAMRGYESDTTFRPKKRLDLGSTCPQVSMEDFEPIKFIGKGAYGTVWLVRKKATGDEYAMKIVDWRDRFSQNRMSALKLEKDIYKMLEGDFVVKAIWTFHYENFICFVTEYMIGGDFNKLLDQLGRLEEDQARFYFAELILAVESLHNLGIVHRDLKPDNILMDAKGHIRLTDFGLSQNGLNRIKGSNTPGGRKSGDPSPLGGDPKKVTSLFDMWNKEVVGGSKEHVEFKTTKKSGDTAMDFGRDDNYNGRVERKSSKIKRPSFRDSASKKKNMVGTPDYMAPEVIDSERITGTYNEKCMDWWSMGVILYQFLVGVPPFCDTTVENVFDNILNYRIDWPCVGYDEDCVSPEAVDLIQKLLDPDYRKRLGVNGVQEIKNHKFFKGFNWEGLREREAIMIPCLIEELAPLALSAEELKEETAKFKFPLSDPGSLRTGPSKRQLRQIDLEAFQMRRLDVLDKLNQETFKNLKTKDNMEIKK